jgi:hypothetical protein
MSLSALKRKTEVKYMNKVSSHTGTFSLTGGHRNVGYVGQTNLSRSLKRTPFTRNNQPQRHGRGPTVVHNSGHCIANDPSILKPTVKTTKGLLATKYKWIKRPYPYSIVQPDDNANTNFNASQGLYLRNLEANNNCVQKKFDEIQVKNTCGQSCTKFIGSKKRVNLLYTKTTDPTAFTQDAYLKALTRVCINKDADVYPPRINQNPIRNFSCS